MDVAEAVRTLRVHPLLLTAGVVIGLDEQIILVELEVVVAIAADGHARAVLDATVQGLRSVVAGGDGVDHELGAGENVAADKDVGVSRLEGEGVCLRIVAMVEGDGTTVEEASPLDGLSDGEDDLAAGDGHGVVLVIERREALGLGVEDLGAALEDDADHVAVLVREDLLGPPAVLDLHAVLEGLGNLRIGGRHLVALLERDHRDGLCTATLGVARAVDGDVAATNDHDVSSQRRVALGHGILEVVDGHVGALGGVAGNPGPPAALASNGHEEGLEALLAQLVERDVATDLDPTANLDAQALDNLDLGKQHVLLELVGRDAVHHHAAWLLVLLEHDGRVAEKCQVVRAGKACRTGTDDGDLLVEVVVDRGNGAPRHGMLGLREVVVGHELLDRVDGDGLVDGATGACVLAALVADAAAHGGERVHGADELDGLLVLALLGLLEVGLDGHVRRASGLAGGRAGRPGVVHASGVAVVLVPGVLAPVDGVRQDGAWVLGLLAV